jgi:membrane-associated protein
MEIIALFVDVVLHIDRHLAELVQNHGAWVYLVLFLIVFVETGLVIMPFLPGDSLLFVVGALAGAGFLNLPLALSLMLVAAMAGDQCNYWIGRSFGRQMLDRRWRWFNERAYQQAHDFYEKHGGITIVVARFMPFIRTFAPFVAGVAHMDRLRFTFFNVAGALIWVIGLGSLGYWFGNIPVVQAHFEKVIWALIILPGLIAIWGAYKAKRQPSA